MRITRRGLQIALGLVWLLDAALQYQPYMFGKQFAHQVLAPSGQGSPAWIASSVHWSATLTAHHPVLLNSIYATVQLLIALGLLWRPTVKAALVASVPWSLAVWLLGEGLGGAFAGAQSPLMGFPGAVIIYALIAVLLWPARDESKASSVAAAGPFGRFGAGVLWAALWIASAVETLMPVNRDHNAIAGMISGMADGEPGWLAHVNNSVGSALTGHSNLVAIGLAVVMVLVAVAPFAPATYARAVIGLSILVMLAIWVVAQDFGAILTGSATDPNSGPLFVLLGLTFWPRRSLVTHSPYVMERELPIAETPSPTAAPASV